MHNLHIADGKLLSRPRTREVQAQLIDLSAQAIGLAKQLLVDRLFKVAKQAPHCLEISLPSELAEYTVSFDPFDHHLAKASSLCVDQVHGLLGIERHG